MELTKISADSSKITENTPLLAGSAESVSPKKTEIKQVEQAAKMTDEPSRHDGEEITLKNYVRPPVQTFGTGIIGMEMDPKIAEESQPVFGAEPQPEGCGLGFDRSPLAGKHEETIENINNMTNLDKQEYDRNANVLTPKHEGLKNSKTSNKRSADSLDTDRFVTRKRSKRSPSGETESSSYSTNSTSSSSEKSVSGSAEGPATSDSLEGNSIQTEGSSAEAAPEPITIPMRANISIPERVEKANDRKRKIQAKQCKSQTKKPRFSNETDDMDDAEQSTLEEYEQIPVECFGMAMLRGMGLKEDAKKVDPKKIQPVSERKPYSPGQGLGSGKGSSIEAHQPKDASPAAGEA